MTRPETALRRLSDSVRDAMFSVAMNVAGLTLNIGRSIERIVRVYIRLWLTPMKTSVSGMLAVLRVWCRVWESVREVSVVSSSVTVRNVVSCIKLGSASLRTRMLLMVSFSDSYDGGKVSYESSDSVCVCESDSDDALGC